MKINKILNLNILIFFVICNFNYGQAPNLRSASGFALFTSEGGIINVGNSFITGDIGTAKGLVKDFSTGVVIGRLQIEDPNSKQTVDDIDFAFKFIDNLVCDVDLVSTLGSHQNLTPNIYCIHSDAILTGDLILDGRGDTNAIFIFKIQGGFTSEAFSNIKMIHGASLWNVYWLMNGEVILGENSVFRGTVITNGPIDLLESATLLGRGLTSKGRVTLNNNIII
ncbi:MAG: DUF3494 domain-containing protein [Saprospiraceae bacterium]|jgi:hypothetical protein|nr:DUF3494 domain-containing protein [Candidatus Defluviibacterium haderslevense]MCI1267805.1 ice-binding family protein [Saprospiraceae bacterium]